MALSRMMKSTPGFLLRVAIALDLLRSTSAASAPLYVEQPIFYNNSGPLDGRNGYYANVSIGTPAQDVVVLVDLGIRDTWVMSGSGYICRNASLDGAESICSTTAFTANQSSTFHASSEVLNVTYMILPTLPMLGSEFTDNISIGGATIESFQMALIDATISPSTLGLGPSLNGSSDGQETRLTVLDGLVDQGSIAKRAFSLYLNDWRAPSGTLLYGAVDTEKYTGDLVTMPLIISASNERVDASIGNSTVMAVSLASISVDMNNGTVAFITATSGTASLRLDQEITTLPPNLTDNVVQAFGAVRSSYLEDVFYVDCNSSQYENSWVEFQLGDATLAGGGGSAKIRITGSQLALDQAQIYLDYDKSSNASWVAPFAETCLLGISFAPTTGGDGGDSIILGRTFLRSAYLVYDLDARQVSVAQAKLNATTTNITVIDESTNLNGTTASGTNATDSTSAAEMGAHPCSWAVMTAAIAVFWVMLGGTGAVFSGPE
ncbi:aspartic peptidase domain-containing protein [Xylariales sp. PMI_506]|nr:aspartic peptidase domain-containing protein [Xylariales sp. PMI_506]